MRENVTYHGPCPKQATPKVLICRAILGLNRTLLLKLYRASGLAEHEGVRELEAFRSEWLRWLDATHVPFHGYTDSYHKFLNDLAVGNWSMENKWSDALQPRE